MTLTAYPPSSTPSLQSKDGPPYTSTPESVLLNLTRLVARLELNLLSSTANLDILRKDPFRRGRVTANIEYARKNLQSLEKSLLQIKPADRRHEILNEVGRLRAVLKSLGGVIEEVAPSDAFEDDEDEEEGDDTSEDLLATPEEDEDEDELVERGAEGVSGIATATTMPTATERERETKQPEPSIPPSSTTTSTTSPPEAELEPEPTSTLRNRHHTYPQPTATATATTTSSNFTPQTQTQPAHSSTLASKEQTLSAHQSEQETLTTSLLDLATQLKTSSQTFQSQLEAEKSVLSRAVDGLDKTSSNMDAAERRMGMLRRMTEGKGWWGRMMLYAWIFAGWVVAVLIVFVGPKVRF